MAPNLFVAAVVVIIGAADYTLRLGSFELAGIGLGTFGAIVLYQVAKLAPGGREATTVDTAVSAPARPPQQPARRSGRRRRRSG